jgi:hypothetical protein
MKTRERERGKLTTVSHVHAAMSVIALEIDHGGISSRPLITIVHLFFPLRREMVI